MQGRQRGQKRDEADFAPMGLSQSRPSGFVGRGGARKRNEADFASMGPPAKPSLRLCGERRSKGACGAFAAGGSGMKRTLRRRGGVLVSTGVPKQE